MPIDIYSSLKKTGQYAFGSSILNSLFGGTWVLAGIIALTMILIIMIMYPAKSGTSISVIFRMFLYMFGISVVLIFLHDGITKYRWQEDREHVEANDFIKNMTVSGRQADPVYGTNYTMVNPGITGKGESDTKNESIDTGTSNLVPSSSVESYVEGGVDQILVGGKPPESTKPNPFHIKLTN